MKANEAKLLSEKNQVKIEVVLKQIIAAAENGSTSVRLFNINQDVILELIKLGYSIRMHKDPFSGTENTICSW